MKKIELSAHEYLISEVATGIALFSKVQIEMDNLYESDKLKYYQRAKESPIYFFEEIQGASLVTEAAIRRNIGCALGSRRR